MWPVAFGFTFAQYYVGARQSVAEKRLQAKQSAGWAGITELLGWVDFILAVQVSLWLAIPAVLGGVAGQYWSVKQEYVQARLRRKRKRLRRLANLPTAEHPGSDVIFGTSHTQETLETHNDGRAS